MLFDHVSRDNRLLYFPVGHFALAHPLFGVGSDDITIRQYGLSEGCNVEFCHVTASLCPFVQPEAACFRSILAQVSRRVAVRLKTSFSGVESGSTQK